MVSIVAGMQQFSLEIHVQVCLCEILYLVPLNIKTSKKRTIMFACKNLGNILNDCTRGPHNMAVINISTFIIVRS